MDGARIGGQAFLSCGGHPHREDAAGCRYGPSAPCLNVSLTRDLPPGVCTARNLVLHTHLTRTGSMKRVSGHGPMLERTQEVKG